MLHNPYSGKGQGKFTATVNFLIKLAEGMPTHNINGRTVGLFLLIMTEMIHVNSLLNSF